jgi:tRNA(fMet)-specific endonuclease VapC
MSLFVLDTDILTLYREGHPVVCRHVGAHLPQELAITVISVEEQLSGWYTVLRRAKTADDLERVYQEIADTVTFFSRIQIISFTKAAIARYEQLKAMKLNVSKTDLRIAAIVQETGSTLVTRNTRDFRRIPHLVFEDWTT